jgi:hypothetical protein
MRPGRLPSLEEVVFAIFVACLRSVKSTSIRRAVLAPWAPFRQACEVVAVYVQSLRPKDMAGVLRISKS